ncbi:hypothetical protein N7475_003078 [Penicillium sp. IBT 31633x]|nr:hypothetical protein N7475_003078 [Penicillium sp. IBT 31633x]
MDTNEIQPDDIFKEPITEFVDNTMIDQPTLVRWYIDVRNWDEKLSSLPLIETLTSSDQAAVRKYYQIADQRMSLASQVLKYYYIHQATGTPWNKIEVQRTPMPQHRPFYDSSLEFNVSHQAGITIFTGTRAGKVDCSSCEPHVSPRVGIDVACVDEPARRRTDRPPKTLAGLATFVDVFSDVLSPGELKAIKSPSTTLATARRHGIDKSDPSKDTEESLAAYGVRLFYSTWALKEAYLKMTGDGLLAPWIKKLEFLGVISPEPVEKLASSTPSHDSTCAIGASVQNWGSPYNNVSIMLDGVPIHGVRVELVAFERDYIVATAASGHNIGSISRQMMNDGDHHLPGYITAIDPQQGPRKVRIAPIAVREIGERDPWRVHRAIWDPWLPMQEVDIDIDIRPCAEGRCLHSQDPHPKSGYVRS